MDMKIQQFIGAAVALTFATRVVIHELLLIVSEWEAFQRTRGSESERWTRNSHRPFTPRVVDVREDRSQPGG